MSTEFQLFGFDLTGTIYKEPIENNVSYGAFMKRALHPIARLGIPNGTLVHSKYIRLIYNEYIKKKDFGLRDETPRHFPLELRKAINYFKNQLFIYDMIVEHKVFSIEELWKRSLIEGSTFAKFIKKSRNFSLQARESIDGIEDSEYVHHEYKGYNSIFHERGLIHWDETEECCDFPYSCMEPFDKFPEDEFLDLVRNLLKKYKVFPYVEDDSIDIIQSVTGKVSSLNRCGEKGTTTLLKNTWTHFEGGPWMASRAIINIAPANTRDAAVPDVSTLNYLKKIAKHARKISSYIPFIADVELEKMQNRVSRLKSKSNLFFHLDFKKYGLATDRRIGNGVLEVIRKDHLKIPDLIYLNLGKETIATRRGGGALGWCDPLFAIGVTAILSNLRRRKGWKNTFDFLIFRDDVEIGFRSIPEEEALYRREIIYSELERFGFLISYRKSYISERFIFLEDYAAHKKWDDMDKSMLAVEQYAKSLSTPFEWKAKFYFSEAYMIYRNAEISELCINSWPKDENDPMRPYEIGGWGKKYDPFSGLNVALEDATPSEIRFYLKMSRYKRPDIMPKHVDIKVSDLEKRKEKLINDAYIRTPGYGEIQLDESRHVDQDEMDRLELFIESEAEDSDDDIPPVLPVRRPVGATGPGPPGTI